MAKDVMKLIEKEIGTEFGVPAGQLLTIYPGQTVRFTCSFKYTGPAKTVTLRCAIMQVIVGVWDEVVSRTGTIPLSAATTPTEYIRYLDVSTANLEGGKTYSVECKIEEYASQTITRYQNVIQAVAPGISDFKIVSYEVV